MFAAVEEEALMLAQRILEVAAECAWAAEPVGAWALPV
jgi:hypothetical protein